MGIFFDKPTVSNTNLTEAFRDALKADPGAIDVEQEAAKRVDDLQTKPGSFQSGRFLIALAILLAFVAAAIWADAAGHPDSSKALYGFAATILGLIVGLLTGEKPSSS